MCSLHCAVKRYTTVLIMHVRDHPGDLSAVPAACGHGGGGGGVRGLRWAQFPWIRADASPRRRSSLRDSPSPTESRGAHWATSPLSINQSIDRSIKSISSLRIITSDTTDMIAPNIHVWNKRACVRCLCSPWPRRPCGTNASLISVLCVMVAHRCSCNKEYSRTEILKINVVWGRPIDE